MKSCYHYVRSTLSLGDSPAMDGMPKQMMALSNKDESGPALVEIDPGSGGPEHKVAPPIASHGVSR